MLLCLCIFLHYGSWKKQLRFIKLCLLKNPMFFNNYQFNIKCRYQPICAVPQYSMYFITCVMKIHVFHFLKSSTFDDITISPCCIITSLQTKGHYPRLHFTYSFILQLDLNMIEQHFICSVILLQRIHVGLKCEYELVI